MPPPLFLTNMKEDFTYYDIKPEGFLNYLRYYGVHFNKKLCEFACNHIEGTLLDKNSVDTILQNHEITLLNCALYDAVVVANWAKSTFYGSSITDEAHFALFLKDIFNKEGELIFNRWYADMAKKGIPIEWEDML